MHKEKILEILENAKDGNGAVPMRLVRTAFDKLPEPCEDTISRQAAIDEVKDWIKSKEFRCSNATYYIKKRINALPPAQPEIIRCKDCKHNVSSHKCLHPESFFLVPSDDFYCGFAERRTDDK